MYAHLRKRSGPRWLACGVALLLLALAVGVRSAWAQALTPTGAPRVNLATWYQVDPKWPQRPAEIHWGQTSGVAVDGQDRVWVFTRADPPVQLYDRSGKLVRSWGTGVIGSAHYMKVDPKGNLWLADAGNHVILQFTPEGKLLRTLGTRGQPGNDRNHFNKPTDMAITPEGHVFVSDGYGNTRIVHLDKEGKYVKEWGKPGIGPGEFSLPHSIAVDSKGRLYVADRSNVRVQVFDQSGKFLDQWRNLLVPWGIWVSKDDEIWVCGSSPMTWESPDQLLGCPPKDQVFMKFDPSGKLLQLWTVPKGEDGKEKPGELNWLHAVALDSQGNIFAVDIKGQRIQKLVRQK